MHGACAAVSYFPREGRGFRKIIAFYCPLRVASHHLGGRMCIRVCGLREKASQGRVVVVSCELCVWAVKRSAARGSRV